MRRIIPHVSCTARGFLSGIVATIVFSLLPSAYGVPALQWREESTPTATPASVAFMLEAEDATLTGCYRQNDPQASGGFRVDGIDAIGDSVMFVQAPGGTHLVFRYATPNTGHMSLYINGIFTALIDFQATPGGWVFPFVDKEVVTSIPEGSSVKLQLNSGDIAINLDYIQIYQAGPTPTPCPSCTPTPCFPFERFDDVSSLGSRGWVIQNNSMPGPGTTGWFQGSRFFSAQTGGYIAADFNSGTGLSTLSDWLLTPPITLQNGMMISFWTRTVVSPSFPDRLQVRMSVNGASTNVGTSAMDVGDFETLLLDINPTYSTTGYPTSWTQFSGTVTGLNGPTTGRLAFRYFVENGGPGGTNSDYIGIDVLQISGLCGPSPTPTPIPTATPSPTEGPLLELLPHYWDFGSAAVGSDSNSHGFTVFWHGFCDPNNLHINLADTTNFSIEDNTCETPGDLSGGCSFVVRFHPSSGGAKSSGLEAAGSFCGGPKNPFAFVTGVGRPFSATPAPTATPRATLGNISTRLRVETGDDVLIGGFIVTGTQPKKVIVRAIGPSLPVSGALADPVLELRNSSGQLIRRNDNWRSDQEQEIIETGIQPSNDAESAIVETLPANGSAYTAIVRGANGGTGVGLVEVYDLDQTVDSNLANISTRGLVQTGNDVMIAGTIVLGEGMERVLVRAIGPSLPVPNALSDPMLELRDANGTVVRANDNWRTDQETEIIATGIPPTNDLESAIVETLAAGSAAYTAIVRGVNDTTGVALVEVYGLAEPPTTPTPTPTPMPTPAPSPTPFYSAAFYENFDYTVPPNLPSGWHTSFSSGPADCTPAGTCPLGTNWTTTNNNPYTGPTCVFHGAPACVTDSVLDTPAFFLPAGYPIFAGFYHRYNLESGRDGAVLEISINGGPFTDIVAAGGAVNYNGTISSGFQSPIAGRAAWTGNSGGYVGAAIHFPSAALGAGVVLRFRLATDCSGGGSDMGWSIDVVYVFYNNEKPTPTPTPMPTSTPGVCTENFDRVAAPALPDNWMASNPIPGDGVMFVTSTDQPDSPPNDAFIPNQDGVSDKVLDRVNVTVNSATARLSFRNNFDSEMSAGVFWDGGVLEVSTPSISNGDFLDITDPRIGGTFVSGGYTGEIAVGADNPLAGRLAWSGNSGGYIDTVINLGPSLYGKTITIRWRFGSDEIVAAPGWRIDNLSILGASCP